jgi:ionotropic glutamate receptor NMDA 2B
MGKTLTFRGTVYEAKEAMRAHKCKDPICDTHLWKVKHELDMARIKMRKLEAELRQRGVEPTTAEKMTTAEAATAVNGHGDIGQR